MRRLLGHNFLLTLCLLYSGIIVWLSVAKIFIPVKINIRDSDKIGHFIAYFGFTVVWFLFLFFSEKFKKSFIKSLLIVSASSAVFGILMEICQAVLTNYRTPDWKDVIANTAGTVFAAIVLVLLKKQLVSFKNLKKNY